MEDWTAIVTGAASGLGAAVAQALSARGVRVVGMDLRPADGVALSLVVDVADAAAVQAAVERVQTELGPVDALVTAAGIYEMAPIEQVDDARWERMLAVNLGGTANACAAVLPGMVRRGGGSVVTVSSDLGLGGSMGDVHYAMSKGAIVGLTRSLADELAGSGVAMSTVAPGAADTPMLEPSSPWRSPEFLATLPVPRLVSTAEIAAAVLYLLEAGSELTGQVLSPNSGATI